MRMGRVFRTLVTIATLGLVSFTPEQKAQATSDFQPSQTTETYVFQHKKMQYGKKVWKIKKAKKRAQKQARKITRKHAK